MKNFIKLITIAILIILGESSPIYAAKVIFIKGVLKNSPESYGINLNAVPSYAISPYIFKKDIIKRKAVKVFKQNPVTHPVWGKDFNIKKRMRILYSFLKAFNFGYQK